MYYMHHCPNASGLYVLGDSSKQKQKYNNLKASILMHEYVWRENFKEKNASYYKVWFIVRGIGEKR